MAEHTWGISGPQFLAIYLGLLAGAVLVTLRLRALVWQRHAEHATFGLVGEPNPDALAPVEVAYLTGGSDLAVLVACMELYRRGVADVPDGLDPSADPSPEELAELTGTPSVTMRDELVGGHPVERRVAQALQHAEDGLSLRAELRLSPEMKALRDGLAQKGFLVDKQLRRRLRLGVVSLLAVLTLGAVRVAAGVANEKPVGFLVLAMAATVSVMVLAWRVPDRTPGAERVLRTLRDRYSPPARRQSRWGRRRMEPVSASARPSSRVNDIDPLEIAALGTATAWAIAPGVAASFGFVPTAAVGGFVGAPFFVGCGVGGGGGGGGGCGGGGGGGGCGG